MWCFAGVNQGGPDAWAQKRFLFIESILLNVNKIFIALVVWCCNGKLDTVSHNGKENGVRYGPFVGGTKVGEG